MAAQAPSTSRNPRSQAHPVPYLSALAFGGIPELALCASAISEAAISNAHCNRTQVETARVVDSRAISSRSLEVQHPAAHRCRKAPSGNCPVSVALPVLRFRPVQALCGQLARRPSPLSLAQSSAADVSYSYGHSAPFPGNFSVRQRTRRRYSSITACAGLTKKSRRSMLRLPLNLLGAVMPLFAWRLSCETSSSQPRRF
jgi:hypothetical protein